MKQKDSLATYREKRDFKKTPEPAGKRPYRNSKEPDEECDLTVLGAEV